MVSAIYILSKVCLNHYLIFRHRNFILLFLEIKEFRGSGFSWSLKITATTVTELFIDCQLLPLFFVLSLVYHLYRMKHPNDQIPARFKPFKDLLCNNYSRKHTASNQEDTS